MFNAMTARKSLSFFHTLQYTHTHTPLTEGALWKECVENQPGSVREVAEKCRRPPRATLQITRLCRSA